MWCVYVCGACACKVALFAVCCCCCCVPGQKARSCSLLGQASAKQQIGPHGGRVAAASTSRSWQAEQPHYARAKIAQAPTRAFLTVDLDLAIFLSLVSASTGAGVTLCLCFPHWHDRVRCCTYVVGASVQPRTVDIQSVCCVQDQPLWSPDETRAPCRSLLRKESPLARRRADLRHCAILYVPVRTGCRRRRIPGFY